MGVDDEPEAESDIKSLLKRARELMEDKPLSAWKLLYDGLPAVHEAVRAGRSKPTLLDAFLNEMAELSGKIPPGELGKQHAATRQRSIWIDKTLEEMQEKLSEARKDSQPLRDSIDAERQARERAQAAAAHAESELKSLTQKLVSTAGQAGEAQTEARQLKETIKKLEAAAAKEQSESQMARSLLRTRESEATKLRASADEYRMRTEEATALLVEAQRELDNLRAKHDALVVSIARGDLLPRETVGTLVNEAQERAIADRPVEVEDASSGMRKRLEEANDSLREAAENERSLKDQVEFLRKQLENQRPALQDYEAVCEALGLDPLKPGALQTKVLGLMARSMKSRGEEK
ncbi:MAG TPA: hypothetical protein VI893_00425 [Thermoplasmata archaeon]|nr:hypothetical protein [Thermoplasmata archaeon]